MINIIRDKKTYDKYWRFIEEWLPDYTHCDMVALSLDIANFLSVGADAANDDCKQNIIDNGGDINDAQMLKDMLERIDTDLLARAFSFFLQTSFK